MSFRWAITNAIDEEMARDADVFVVGEDVAEGGGVFGLTRGLLQKYGELRVRDTPISEEAIVGLGVGAAALGLRPIVEIMFMDFIYLAMDQLANHAAKMRYMSGGQVHIPLVVHTLSGGGFRAGMHHSQSLESLFGHIPGLKVVMPSDAWEAKGLFKASVRDPDPVIFMEPKSLLSSKSEIADEEYLIPLGRAAVKRPGRDATVVAIGAMVGQALEAARELAGAGIAIEVIDARTVMPLDAETILGSVKKTSRLVVAHEAPAPYGFGAEIAALAAERALYDLDAPVLRVAGKFAPIPVGRSENQVLPAARDIVDAVYRVLKGG
ncbi:MAG: alpha-ketoacid dehydrogenase subunit beta [Thermaerobacter sp.]|nr:alpha-ketoacid dehydrogenase subunit beta [Thermaerobacter sp.]